MELDKDEVIARLLRKVGELVLEIDILREAGHFPERVDAVQVPLEKTEQEGPTS